MPALGAVTETQLRRAGDICMPRKLGHCGAVFVLRMARQLRAKLLKPKERGSFETFWHDNQAIRAAFVGGSAVGSPSLLPSMSALPDFPPALAPWAFLFRGEWQYPPRRCFKSYVHSSASAGGQRELPARVPSHLDLQPRQALALGPHGARSSPASAPRSTPGFPLPPRLPLLTCQGPGSRQ